MGRERTLVSPPLVQGAWFLSPLFADDLDQHALAAAAVELAVENPLPGTEVEFARRNRDHYPPRPMIWRFMSVIR